MATEDSMLRARAIVFFGSLATNEDIALLESALVNDEINPAIQAGYALLNIDTDESLKAVNDILQRLSESETRRDREVYRVISSTLARMREVNSPTQ